MNFGLGREVYNRFSKAGDGQLRIFKAGDEEDSQVKLKQTLLALETATLALK
jgi:hypothetical protein